MREEVYEVTGGRRVGGVSRMFTVVFVGAVALGWAATSLYCALFATAARRRRIAARPIVAEGQWCEAHFPDLDGEGRKHAIAVCAIFARTIGVAPTQLLPTDCVRSDYCLGGICRPFDDSREDWSSDLGRYVTDATMGRVSDADLEGGSRCGTLDDFVRKVSELLARHRLDEPGGRG